MTTSESIVYLLSDVLGGVTSIISNLLRYRKLDQFRYDVVLMRYIGRSVDRPNPDRLLADSLRAVTFDGMDNVEKVLQHVHEAIPAGEGVAVSNEGLGLAALTRYNSGRAVFHILHNDSNDCYEVAKRYDHVVDGFITYARLMYEKSQQLLPHRRDTIFYLPYGVPIPQERRTASDGPIRLLFAARLIREKGIYELPGIDEALLARGVRASWTVVGSGPGGDEVRREWRNASVRWTGALPNSDVLRLCQEHDIFVFPTTFPEGLPVALLEAMAAGVVPVATNLPGGLQEAVQHGLSGYLHPPSDIDGFAASIASLHRDRAKLDSMSMAARQRAQEEFDIQKRVLGYQNLFARWRELRRPRSGHGAISYGSRLDKEWIPNWVVRTARRIRRRMVPTVSGTRGAEL